MKIKSIHIKDFRRFTDLKITGLPEVAKLIILCGPNGSGKSSLFDALRAFQSYPTGVPGYNHDVGFYPKLGSFEPSAQQQDFRIGISVDFHDSTFDRNGPKKKLFYLRTAFRNDVEFSISGFARTGPVLEESRPPRTIDNDVTVQTNYVRLVIEGVQALFDDQVPADTSIGTVRERLMGETRVTLNNIFPDLLLSGVGKPLEEGSFYFTKGTVKSFIYKNLSAGEKAVFDLILDLIIKREYFDDTIWLIDEPEVHLNTRIQSKVLRELVRIVPDGSQLILATHSIGFLKEAWELSKEKPGYVAFLDFQEQDFDQPVELTPIMVTREFWRRTLDVALGDVASLVAPEQVVLCEGGGDAAEQQGFDAKCYSKVFSCEFPNVDFVSVGNSHDVSQDRIQLGKSIQTIVDGIQVRRLIDRDDKTDSEVLEKNAQGIRVLSRRNIESYLLDDDVLDALCISVNKPERTPELIAKRHELLRKSVDNGGAPDDLKKIAKSFRGEAVRLLQLSQAGSTWPAFATDTLAPLIQPGSSVYADLKEAIFG